MLVVAAESGRREWSLAAGQYGSGFQIGQGPKLGNARGVTGQRGLGIGRDGNDTHGRFVMHNFRCRLGKVPQSDGRIVTAGRHLRELGMEGDGRHWPCVRAHAAARGSIGKVP